MISYSRLLPVALICLALWGCGPSRPAYLARPEPIPAVTSYDHGPSGMTFPVAVASLRRTSLLRYDAAGLDVSAGYSKDSEADEVATTVYVYPAPSLVSVGSPPEVVVMARANLCRGEFERNKKAVVSSHSGARLVAEKEAADLGGWSGLPGRTAVFEYEDVFLGERQPVRSELHVLCFVGERWSVKYRFTYPRDFDASRQISAFMSEVPRPRPAGFKG